MIIITLQSISVVLGVCSMTAKHDGLSLSLQLHTRLHKLEQERREQNAKKMETYTQQVALEQLKDESKDKARLAQKLAELEVLLPFLTRYCPFCKSYRACIQAKQSLV